MSFEIRSLSGGYRPGSQVINNVSLDVDRGEIVCLVGSNGAGKSSTLRAIMAMLPYAKGEILVEGKNILGLPAHRVPAHGIGFVPQGRRLFAPLTVRENLEVGALPTGRQPDLERVLSMFPALETRLSQVSGTLSGGEQQMLAMARALSLEPRLLLLDEPTEGLMPTMIRTIVESTRAMAESGVGILLVEQRIDAVMSVADRVAFMENGSVMETVPAEGLTHDDQRVRKYVGIG